MKNNMVIDKIEMIIRDLEDHTHWKDNEEDWEAVTAELKGVLILIKSKEVS